MNRKNGYFKYPKPQELNPKENTGPISMKTLLNSQKGERQLDPVGQLTGQAPRPLKPLTLRKKVHTISKGH